MNVEHDDKLTWKEKGSFAAGAIPGAFFTTFLAQINAFYVAWMRLDWTLIVVAQVIYATWNALNDPLFGILQDRTRAKGGRYLPWIKWCAPFFSISFLIVFVPPAALRFDSFGEHRQVLLFAWYLCSQLLFDTCFTITFLAHTALFPQLTMNETERTKIALLFGVLGIAGAAASGVFPVVLLTDPTEASILVFQVLVACFAAGGLVPWLVVTRGVRERLEYIPPRQHPPRESIRALLSNPASRAFLAFDGITAGINFTIMTSITFVLGWVFGMNNAHLQANPSWTFASLIPAGFVVFCGLVIGVATCLVLQHRRDVRTVFSLSFLLQAIGFFMAFLGTLPVPGTPSLIYALPQGMPIIVLGAFIASIGMPADYILHAVVRSDVIDFDEHLTGERREAIYAGFGTVFSKIMTSVALAIVPATLAWFGLVPADPANPATTAMVVPSGDHGMAIAGVGVAAFLIPSILATFGLVTWRGYPLGRKQLREIRHDLAKVHAAKRRDWTGTVPPVRQSTRP